MKRKKAIPPTGFNAKTEAVITLLLVAAIVLMVAPASAWADNNAYIMRGVARTLFSVFQLPKTMIQESVQFFPFGIVTGAVKGSLNTVLGTLGGLLDIAKGAAPYAKYVAPFFI